MSRATLLFTRKDKGSMHDDKIVITPYSGSREFFEIKYHCPELKSDRRFLSSFSGVLNYVDDIL